MYRKRSGGKIEPGVRRYRIQRQSRKIVANGARGVGILEVVLPMAAEKIPVARVSGLQVRGAHIAFGSFETSVMSGECISDAEVRKDQGDSERSKNK